MAFLLRCCGTPLMAVKTKRLITTRAKRSCGDASHLNDNLSAHSQPGPGDQWMEIVFMSCRVASLPPPTIARSTFLREEPAAAFVPFPFRPLLCPTLCYVIDGFPTVGGGHRPRTGRHKDDARRRRLNRHDEEKQHQLNAHQFHSGSNHSSSEGKKNKSEIVGEYRQRLFRGA